MKSELPDSLPSRYPVPPTIEPITLSSEDYGIGAEFVSHTSQERDRLSQTTLPEGTRPAGIVRPVNREQVQQILKQASEQRIPVYPISCGRNWGYGDACAPKDGMLILDLSRMNRIIEINAELAYAVIEPGVTQGQLANYLEQKKIPLIMDGNGAGPDASLIGNILERGFGHSRYGDRFTHSCNYEAVLADGTLFTTGYGGYPQAQAQHVYKHGMGPSLDGLLTQSNLAVITRMTVWLQPKPECINFFFITLKNEEAIGPLIDRLRPLVLAGTLRSTIHCFNDRRLLASESRFPWEQAKGDKGLEISHPGLLRTLYKKYKIPSWAVSGSLTGSPLEVAAMRKTIRRALRGLPGLDRLVFLNERNLHLTQVVAKTLKRFSIFEPTVRFLEKVGIGIGLLKGNPSYLTLKGAHWRSRENPDAHQNPLNSGAGLIWVNCVLPMASASVSEINRLSEPVFHEFGFEFQTTLSFVNERALCAIMSISFDHQNKEEKNRAAQCEEKLLRTLLDAGYLPYRASVNQQRSVFSRTLTQTTCQIKKALDPNNVIAPGRYIPENE